MKYSYLQLESDLQALNAELAEIRKDRGERYGSEEDTLANVRNAGGWRAAYVHAHECIARIQKNFHKLAKDIDDKDFENAVGDLINYSFYILLLYQQERDNEEN